MEIERLEHIATLIGEPARIKILWSLMDGKAHTATELAIIASISPQSASMHLHKLLEADLLKVIAQGRHRYYSFAKNEVAYAIEAMAGLTQPAQVEVTEAKAINQARADSPFRYCRSCYDHLAGQAGVAITDGLLQLNYLVEIEQTFQVSHQGHLFFQNFGIDTEMLSKHKRILARPCLDWSERRLHLAGSIAAAMLTKMINDQWLRRVQNTRTLAFTSVGKGKLYDMLGVAL